MLKMQEHLPPRLQTLISYLGRQDQLYTPQELAKYTSDNPAGGGKIYMAILGEVFDVSAKPQFYGRHCGHRGGCLMYLLNPSCMVGSIVTCTQSQGLDSSTIN
jgi:predicted heme/steroid binding protein